MLARIRGLSPASALVPYLAVIFCLARRGAIERGQTHLPWQAAVLKGIEWSRHIATIMTRMGQRLDQASPTVPGQQAILLYTLETPWHIVKTLPLTRERVSVFHKLFVSVRTDARLYYRACGHLLQSGHWRVWMGLGTEFSLLAAAPRYIHIATFTHYNICYEEHHLGRRYIQSHPTQHLLHLIQILPSGSRQELVRFWGCSWGSATGVAWTQVWHEGFRCGMWRRRSDENYSKHKWCRSDWYHHKWVSSQARRVPQQEGITSTPLLTV